MGHAADENVRVGREPSKLEVAAAGRPHLRHPVDREYRAVLVPLHLHLVPVAVVEVPAHCDDLGAAAQVVPEPQRALDQLDLEEVVRAPVVRVEQQAVRLLGLELELEAAVRAAAPLAELGVGLRGAVQQEPGAHAGEAEEHELEGPHRDDDDDDGFDYVRGYRLVICGPSFRAMVQCSVRRECVWDRCLNFVSLICMSSLVVD